MRTAIEQGRNTNKRSDVIEIHEQQKTAADGRRPFSEAL